jgi:hypothetical protein
MRELQITASNVDHVIVTEEPIKVVPVHVLGSGISSELHELLISPRVAMLGHSKSFEVKK